MMNKGNKKKTKDAIKTNKDMSGSSLATPLDTFKTYKQMDTKFKKDNRSPDEKHDVVGSDIDPENESRTLEMKGLNTDGEKSPISSDDLSDPRAD